jgi:hypothetical protein
MTAAGAKFAKEAVMVIGSAKIPRYILRDSLGYASPRVLLTSRQIGASVLYGFSDKPEYDDFISSNESALMPYPLVRGYLERSLDNSLLQLIVLDAEFSQQSHLRAATFDDVLDSFRNNAPTVRVTHQLMIDTESAAYRIEEINYRAEASDALLQINFL